MSSLFSHPSALSGTYTPTPLQSLSYGPGSISLLHELIHNLSSPSSSSPPSDASPSTPTKVLIVTGNSLANKTPVIREMREMLEKADIQSAVFEGIGQHARE